MPIFASKTASLIVEMQSSFDDPGWRRRPYRLHSGDATIQLTESGKHCRGLAFACVHSPARFGQPVSGYFSLSDEINRRAGACRRRERNVRNRAVDLPPARDYAAARAWLRRVMSVSGRPAIDTAKSDALRRSCADIRRRDVANVVQTLL